MRRFATSCLLVVALTVAATFALPASYEKESDSSDDAEFIVVPLSHQRPSFHRYPSTSFENFDGVVDTGDFYPVPARPIYFPSYNPFSWHLTGYLDDLMKRVRDRFAGSWNPFYGGDLVPSGPGVWPVGIPEDSSEDGAATNSTSTVKVIDGHKVVINDTYYTKKTDFGTSIFKVRVIDVKPVDETPAGEAPKPETPTEVEVNNRNGEDDDAKEPSAPSTDAPKRDTELESSDEEKTTDADEKLNTIDTSNVDIDEAKPKEKDALTEKSESSEQWKGLESFEGPSHSDEKKMAEQRNRATSELLNGSSEEEYSYDSLPDADQSRSPQWNEWPVKLEETSRLKQHRIIVPSSNQFEHVFNEHQERPLADEGTPEPAHDLTNDIAINFRLATDRSVTVNPFAITFDPTAKPSVVVQRDPFPGAGSFPGPNGRPSMGFPPQQQPGGGGAFPMAGGSFPGFPAPGGQFPVQPFPMQPPLFTVPGVGPTPNFGFPQNPQAPPFFFGNGQFGRP